MSKYSKLFVSGYVDCFVVVCLIKVVEFLRDNWEISVEERGEGWVPSVTQNVKGLTLYLP